MLAHNTPFDVGAALLRDFSLRANRGIQLTRHIDHGLLARPLGPGGAPDAASPTVALPSLPARVLERGAGFLRQVWRARRTSAVWWLYLHPRRRRWWAYCPPQLCAEWEIQVNDT